MNEDDFINVYADVTDLKQKMAVISDNYVDACLCNNVTYNLEERLNNVEKKIDEIYKILFNAKRLDVSDLNN